MDEETVMQKYKGR